jgi:hypothetical protein
VRAADRRILSRRAAHVDNIAFASRELIGFDHRNVLERTGVPIADETIAIERAGKIQSVQTVARFENVKDADDPARLARMGQVNVHSLEEWLLLE